LAQIERVLNDINIAASSIASFKALDGTCGNGRSRSTQAFP
jgi:hypothetical protein